MQKVNQPCAWMPDDKSVEARKHEQKSSKIQKECHVKFRNSKVIKKINLTQVPKKTHNKPK